MEGAQEMADFKNQGLSNGMAFYLKEKAADVHFTFGAIEYKSNRIPAHKVILSANSRVFDAMFYGDLKEPDDINLPDTTEAAFMEFLQYFYLSKVTLTAENVVGVLYLGEKYDVAKCVSDCIKFLMQSLNHENVCAYMDVAIQYDNEKLMHACNKYILFDTAAVFQSDGFLKCDKNVLGHILKIDILSCSEVDVFEACMSWVKARIGRADLTIDLVESHLGHLYYDIRFASFTMEQLCTLQAKYKSVLTRDFITITNIIVFPQFQPANFTKCDRKQVFPTPIPFRA